MKTKTYWIVKLLNPASFRFDGDLGIQEVFVFIFVFNENTHFSVPKHPVSMPQRPQVVPGCPAVVYCALADSATGFERYDSDSKK